MASATMVSDQLWKCWLQTFGREDREKMYYAWAYDALSWWIITGRASLPWEDAFCKADPKKLMKFAAKHAGAHETCIKEVTKYLRRYCGLEKEDVHA